MLAALADLQAEVSQLRQELGREGLARERA